MNHFVLVYDRSTGTLVELTAYAEADAAIARKERGRLEAELFARPEMEVVLLGADSEAALRRTHSRYFKSAQELAASA